LYKLERSQILKLRHKTLKNIFMSKVMATKTLKNENQFLRSEVQDLKSQLNKVSQDLNTQMSIAKTAIEKTQDNANPNHSEGEEHSKAVEFLSKQYGDLDAFRKQASQDLKRIDKNLDKVSRRCDEIAEAIEATEEYIYQYNIKITNVPQVGERESAETIAKLCVKLFSAMGVEDVSLQLQLQDIDIAHRVPHRRVSQYPDAIICKFVRRLAKRKVMHGCS
jgi:prefoldin subunit 5